jgi:hypothetical protein
MSKKDILHWRMGLPNSVKLCKQAFLAQPKPHRIKYAEKHRVVENDMLKLQEFFMGCHDADARSGIFAKIMEGKKTIRPRNRVVGTGTNPPIALTTKTDTTKTQYGYWPYERCHQDDRQYHRNPPCQDRKDC